MPRLMLCPSSVRKARMLSCLGKSPDTSHPSSNKLSSSKSVVRGLSADLADERGEKEVDHNMASIGPRTNSPPASCAKESRTKSTPSQSKHELDQLSFDAIETIDLTGEVALPFSSTTDPCKPPRLRNERAISFQGCREKRGKKRKSDECTPGLLALSEYASEIETPSKLNSSPLAGNIFAELPATPSRHSPPNDAKLSKRTIADENNHDDSSDTWSDIDSIFPDGGLQLSPQPSRSNSREDRETETTRQPNSQLYSNDATPRPPCIAWNSNPSQLQNPESLPITKVSNTQRADISFIEFLAIHSETLAQLMSILKEQLHNNAEVIYQQAIKGRPAPDLIAANKDLVSQIQTMESLQTSRSAHQNCATHKEDLKQSLVRMISEGSDPTTMPELAQSRVLEAEMGKIEAKIRELLPRAKIFDMACNFGTDNLSTWLSKISRSQIALINGN